MAPKAISYDRWSSAPQGKGDSERRQFSAADDYCTRHHLELDARYVDRGVSGWRGKNVAEGDLARLIDDARSGVIAPGTHLLIENFDRLSRLPLMRAFGLFSSLLDLGLVIVNLTDGRQYRAGSLDDLAELLVPLVLMSRAHEESNRKSALGRAARAARRDRVRSIPGTKFSRNIPEWLRAVGAGECFKVEPIDERVKVALRILEECAGGLGKRAIAARLNKAGIPAFRGSNGWHHSSVSKLVANDALIGIFHPHRKDDGRRVPDGPPVEGYFPIVVPPDLFWRAQAAVASRDHKKAGARGKTFSNLLMGLGRCSDCGATLAFINKGPKPKGGQYLVCGAASRQAGCDNRKHHPYPEIERNTLGLLAMFNLDALIGKPDDVDTKRESEVEAAIASKTAEADRWAEAFGKSGSPTAKRRIDKLDAEIAALEAELEAHRRQAHIVAAQRGRDEHAEFRALLAQLDSGPMADEELFLLRARLHRELARRIEVVEVSGSGVTAELKTRPGMARYVVPIPLPQAGVLPVWSIDGLRSLPYTETPIEEAWDPEELAAWRARG